ncbi:isocitrate lyase/phosphoenolpyruvate mutase family protein [Burkholderia ubonensis]|uniref:isocitrate lyase/phosphoenolpyruvate mutase family protein n=1 Tax=Burkholderia ubonensis TaxID=101571 RepID=UPI0018DF705F
MRRQAGPLLLANVWDVASARASKAAGHAAVGTSSAANRRYVGPCRRRRSERSIPGADGLFRN